MRKLLCLIVVLCSFLIVGCTEEIDNPLHDVDIDAIDQIDIEAGVYEIPFTIEDLDRLMEEYQATVFIHVVDQDNNEIDVFNQSIEVIEGYVYTVTIRIEVGDFSKEKTITVTAVSIIETFIVTFDFNDQLREAIEVTVLKDAKIAEPETPTFEDHEFLGWSTSIETPIYWDFENGVVTNDMTLYAIWETEAVQLFIVSYYVNDGSSDLFFTDYNDTGMLKLIDGTPEKEGFVFLGWFYDALMESKALDGDLLTVGISLYAGWQEVITVTVTFDFNDQLREAIEVTVLKDAKVVEPETPTLENHEFLGWSTSIETPIYWDFENGVVTNDMTLYAIWETEAVQLFIVSYYVNDGSSDLFFTDYNDTGMLKLIDGTPEKEGFVFLGWFYDALMESKALDGDLLTVGISLYAGWQEVITLTVTFDLNHNELTSFEILVQFGQPVSKPRDPLLGNHNFLGWSISSDVLVLFDFDQEILEHMTLFAIWESSVETYSITYYLNDGTSSIFFVDESIDGTAYLISNQPTRQGYAFDGWFLDELCLVPMETMMEMTDDLSIYACWILEQTVTLSFDMGTDEVAQLEPITIVIGQFAEYPLPDPWRMEYHFLGWFLDVSTDDLFDFESTPIYEDMTLYAKWMSWYGEFFVITYYLNDGTNDILTTDNVSEGPLFLIGQVPSRNGFTFEGWFLDQEQTLPAENGYMIDQDTSIYAGWSDAGVQLDVPSNLTLFDGVLSFDPYELVDGQVTAISFFIYINEVHVATTFTNSHNITHLLIEDGMYVIAVVAKGDGTFYLDSEMSEPLEVLVDSETDNHFLYIDNVFLGVTITGLTQEGLQAIRASKELIIPNRINHNEVTVIGAEAFKLIFDDLNNEIDEDETQMIFILDKVFIPNSVKRIEMDAFLGLSTLELIFGNRLEYIGKSAFMGLSGIDRLNFPISLIEIDEAAFKDASGVKYIYFGEYLKHIRTNAFSNLYDLQIITFDPSSRLETIGNNAFENAWEIVEIIFPNSLKSIGSHAFEYAYALTSITLGLGLEFIADGAFRNCPELRFVTSYATQAPVLDGFTVFALDQNISFPYQFQTETSWAPYFE